MSKRAEEAALKAYPKEDSKMWHSAFGTFEFDKNAGARKACQQGYEQAEKDMYDSLLVFLKEKYREYSNNGELKERNTIIKVIDELNKFMYE